MSGMRTREHAAKRQWQVRRITAGTGLSLILSACVFSMGPLPAQAAEPHAIAIDGRFDDWAGITTYTDPVDDQHDTDGKSQDYRPRYVDHPDVDLLEFRFTHDAENLYAYFKSRGAIGRTQTEENGSQAGRYYANVTIDVDDNDETGYWLHEGGYFPASRGYDVNGEIEWYNNRFNVGKYVNHGCLNADELKQAHLDQSSGQYTEGNDGPYPAGFLRVAPGTYEYYTQWSYHEDGTLTFTRDKGPTLPGVISYGLSEDGHELEMCIPRKGFLTKQDGQPVIPLGQKIDVSFSLEASGELAPDPSRSWASDTGEPIVGYVLEAP